MLFVLVEYTASEIRIKFRTETRILFSERSPQTFAMYRKAGMAQS